ncbi:MAG: hypothetical protein ACSLFF_05400 [Solirubrobacterales bacterium]
MRKKIALLSVLSALAVGLFAVPSASASYISVTVGYEAVDLCRTAPDVLSYRLQFKAKIRRSGVPKPDKVRIGYQVLDSNSLAVVRSGVTSLKRSKGYKGKTSRISGTAGQNLTYHLNMQYTVLGKTSKSKTTGFDTIPSVETMDAAGVRNC